MNTTKQHIVIVSSEFPPQPGGIGNHAYNLAFYLSRSNFRVEVITDQRSKQGFNEMEFDRSLPFMVNRINLRQWRPIMYLNRIWVTNRKVKTGSVIIATGKFSLWNVGLLSRFYKTKNIAIIHGTEVNFKSKWTKKSIDLALTKFDHIVAVSNYTKSLIDHLNLNVEVIPNGITVSNWKPDESSNIELKGNPVLTTVGRVSYRKGQLNVIRHLPELIQRYPDVHYHCIGIPTEVEQCKRVAKELRVENYVSFHGSLEDTELQHLLNQTDIFVMLSRESKTGDVEGFGIAILEANAKGIPAIGSVNCGIEDAIRDGVTGRLIQSESSEAFSNAISELLSNKEQYRKGALEWAKQHDWSKVIHKYLNVIACEH